MQMNEFTIIEPNSQDDLADYYRIRYEVLRKPWNQPVSSTKDDTESSSIHILVKNSESISVATGRIQFNTADEAQIRSMAVSNECQGLGIGSLMMNHLEKIALEKNIKTIVLDARENAIAFYEKNGYEIVSTSYLLFGEIQHFKMKKIFI